MVITDIFMTQYTPIIVRLASNEYLNATAIMVIIILLVNTSKYLNLKVNNTVDNKIYSFYNLFFNF